VFLLLGLLVNSIAAREASNAICWFVTLANFVDHQSFINHKIKQLVMPQFFVVARLLLLAAIPLLAVFAHGLVESIERWTNGH